MYRHRSFGSGAILFPRNEPKCVKPLVNRELSHILACSGRSRGERESAAATTIQLPHMIFNWFDWKRDGKEYPKIHPSQKPISVLKRLIETFTDPGDVVIDPCAGSGSTLRAARELGRNSYGFEVSRDFYRKANEQMLGEEASA